MSVVIIFGMIPSGRLTTGGKSNASSAKVGGELGDSLEV